MWERGQQLKWVQRFYERSWQPTFQDMSFALTTLGHTCVIGLNLLVVMLIPGKVRGPWPGLCGSWWTHRRSTPGASAVAGLALVVLIMIAENTLRELWGARHVTHTTWGYTGHLGTTPGVCCERERGLGPLSLLGLWGGLPTDSLGQPLSTIESWEWELGIRV